MKKKLPIFVVAAASALTLTLTAWSAEPKSKKDAAFQQKVFNILDANKDKKVTEKEFVITGLYEIFNSFDLDGSGKVSKEEFMEATKGHKIDHAAEWATMSRGSSEITFKQSLRNKVAVEEMKAHFKKIDKKGKGYVTLNDLR